MIAGLRVAWRRRHGRRTLRGRVSLLAVMVIACWLIILAAGFDAVLASRLNRQIDDALRVRAQAASATVIIRGGRIVGVRESSTDSVLDSSIWVFAGTQAIVAPDLDRRSRIFADTLARSDRDYADHDDRRFYALPVRMHGRRVGSVIAVIDLDPYERTRNTAIFGSVVVTVLLLAGAYPVLRIATGRALRPVAQMTRQAAEWSVNAPTERFGHQSHHELESLADTLDELLDRLAAVLRHERQLSAELSHELRTPLARVAAQVDLMVDDARPDQLAELRALREHCSAMDGIIDTLLAAARTELVRTVGRCELAPVLAGFASTDGHPVVVVDGVSLTVGVEADVVTRILAPVLDNARRYAVDRVHLRAHRIDHEVAVDVSNDGPRLAHDLAERVFEPGFRARPDDDHDGAGLGLSLARRLARAADGDLSVDVTSTCTTFRLMLPAG